MRSIAAISRWLTVNATTTGCWFGVRTMTPAPPFTTIHWAYAANRGPVVCSRRAFVSRDDRVAQSRGEDEEGHVGEPVQERERFKGSRVPTHVRDVLRRVGTARRRAAGSERRQRR